MKGQPRFVGFLNQLTGQIGFRPSAPALRPEGGARPDQEASDRKQLGGRGPKEHLHPTNVDHVLSETELDLDVLVAVSSIARPKTARAG